jgi:hypothetical protein
MNSIQIYLKQFERSREFEEYYSQPKFQNNNNNNKIVESKQDEIEFDQLRQLVIDSIPITIQSSSFFLSQVPGLSELPDDLIGKYIRHGTMDFYLISHSNLFRDGDYYFYFENGWRLTRSWMNKLRGKERTDAKFDAVESFNKLELTNREKAVFLVYVYSTFVFGRLI